MLPGTWNLGGRTAAQINILANEMVERCHALHQGRTTARFLVRVQGWLSVKVSVMTPWTVARQAPLSMGFSRREYWNGLPFPSPGNLPDPGIEPGSSALQVESLPLSHQGRQKSLMSWTTPMSQVSTLSIVSDMTLAGSTSRFQSENREFDFFLFVFCWFVFLQLYLTILEYRGTSTSFEMCLKVCLL